MALMNRSWLSRLAFALVLVCFVTKALALDDSEITALYDFYTANKAALAALSPAWTADATTLCNSSTPWQGITCTDNHVTGLYVDYLLRIFDDLIPMRPTLSQLTDLFYPFRCRSLSKIALDGTIPSSIGGLAYITTMYVLKLASDSSYAKD